MRNEDVPFSSIPRHSALFLKYLNRDADALRFYPHEPTLESLEKAAGEIAQRPFPRNEMAAILRRQNESFGADGEVFRSIDALEKSDSVAIITGQQTGLFIGPLYTIYKALTAVRLAAWLRRRGINAVPVFWMEADDHDFPEATRRAVPDGEGRARTIDFGPKLFPEAETSMRSVGSLRFTEAVRNATKEYLENIPDSACKTGVAEMLEAAYAPGGSFTEAFAVLTHRLLPETGLILFNPGDKEAKRLAAPVFYRALTESEQIRSALIRRNEELSAAGFHAQVQVIPGSTVLFLTLGGKRQAVEKRGEKFHLKNSGEKFDCAQMLELAERTPEIFSPNVLLRPIVQDYLFPTAAYAGGAAEIAYFAQIETLYSIFGRPMPVIWPRNGFTLIEPEIADAMDKTGVGFSDLFLEKPEFEEKVLRLSESSSITIEKLDSLYEKLDAALTEIRPDAGKIEARLDGMTDVARKKILHNVRYLKSRAVRYETARSGAAVRDADVIMNNLRPEGALQERELTIFHFLAKHGPGVLSTINDATDIENFRHRLVYMDRRSLTAPS